MHNDQASARPGTTITPLGVYDMSEAFDVCRELDRPIVVRVSAGKQSGEMWKVFPSGWAKRVHGVC